MAVMVADLSLGYIFRKPSRRHRWFQAKDLNIGETPRVWRREIQGQIFCLLDDPGNLGVFSLCMEWSGQSKIGVVCVNDGIWQWNFETTKPNHSSWMCETVNLLQYLKTHKDETVTFQMFHVYKCLKQAVIVLVCGFFWYRYLPWYTFIYLYIYMYVHVCIWLCTVRHYMMPYVKGKHTYFRWTISWSHSLAKCCFFLEIQLNQSDICSSLHISWFVCVYDEPGPCRVPMST